MEARHWRITGIVLSVPGLMGANVARVSAQDSLAPKRATAGVQDVDEAVSDAWKAGTKHAAVAAANKVLGLERTEGVHVDGQIELVANDNTPFLDEQINRRPLWHLTVSNWRLSLKTGGREPADVAPRTFDVYVEPVSGSVLKIISRWPEGVPAIQPMPSAAFAEQCMRRSGNERYHGFPEEPPGVSFVEALHAVQKHGVGDPVKARQILAHYVLQSKMDRDPVPVWAITLWGIPPIPLSDPSAPLSARNHVRNIVDARTGNWISAGTSPQPEFSEPQVEDRIERRRNP